MVHPKVVTFYDKLVSISHVLGNRNRPKMQGVSAREYEKEFVDGGDEYGCDDDEEEMNRLLQGIA